MGKLLPYYIMETIPLHSHPHSLRWELLTVKSGQDCGAALWCRGRPWLTSSITLSLHLSGFGFFPPIIKMRNWAKEFLAVTKIRFLPKTGLSAPWRLTMPMLLCRITCCLLLVMQLLKVWAIALSFFSLFIIPVWSLILLPSYSEAFLLN